MFERVRTAIAKRLAPFSELGVGGSVSYGGYVQSDDIKPNMQGPLRWRKAQEILADVSIVAASVRYYMNLLSRPAWKCEPPSDKAEAKAAAEFMESVLHGTDTSWSRIVRRSGPYRFHGFGFHEWTAMRRPDGRIGLAAIEPRPQSTIQRWDRDDHGSVLGVFQRNPQTGREIYLPREKLVYLVDDMLTDNPMGLGWYRHLIDPAAHLNRLLKLELIGFERDLSGIPVGRAPIAAINKLIGTQKPDGSIFSAADAEEMIKGIRDFLQLKAKQPDTSLLIDSQPFTSKTDQGGKQVSAVAQWGIELLTASAKTSIEALGNSIRRVTFDMALIMGTQGVLVGREGEGSRALSEDVSRNLYLNINATLGDMAEAYDRDLVGMTWALNGLPDELRPTLRVEDAAFKDAAKIAASLRDMATAGAVLDPADPVINEVRDLLGVSHAPELSDEELGILRGTIPPVEPDEPSEPKPGK